MQTGLPKSSVGHYVIFMGSKSCVTVGETGYYEDRGFVVGQRYLVRDQCGPSVHPLNIPHIEGGQGWNGMHGYWILQYEEAYLCLGKDGTYFAHEGSLENVPEYTVMVWEKGSPLRKVEHTVTTWV